MEKVVRFVVSRSVRAHAAARPLSTLASALRSYAMAMLDDDDRDDEEDPRTSQNERALTEGLVLGRVVWFGGKDLWWRDWVFWVENEHTLVSTWRGHALHPFERFDRVCYFLCVLCFSLFLSAYVQHEHPIHAGFGEYCLWITLSSALLVARDARVFFSLAPS